MRNGAFFILKEGLGGLLQARLSGLAATATVTISLVLIGIFLAITININRLIQQLRSQVELEVFLNDGVDAGMVEELRVKIQQLEGVASLEYVSKDNALAEYDRLFRGHRENYMASLGHNPLPASLRVKLTEGYRNSTAAELVVEQLRDLEEISSEDVVYRREYLRTLEKYIKMALVVDLVVGAVLCLSAVLLVSNNIRLIILSKKRIVETMRLVGATSSFVRTPMFIQGIVQGLLGGLLSALFLYGLVALVTFEIPGDVQVGWQVYLILLNLGIFLGFSGSFWSVKKYM